MAVRIAHSIELRRMVVQDLDAVVGIEQLAHSHPWSRELIRRELDHEWSSILVAVERVSLAGGGEPADTVVGFIIWWRVHDELHVLNVATHPDWRRRGIGRALLVEAEAVGRQAGAVLSTLEVRRSNEPAITLYRSLGYRQVGVRPRYYADNDEDALVMVKDLRG